MISSKLTIRLSSLASAIFLALTLAPMAAVAADNEWGENTPTDVQSSAEQSGDDQWGDDDWGDDGWGEDEDTGIAFNGFIEGGIGIRTQNDPVIDEDLTLSELRARLETSYQLGDYSLSFKGDGLYDNVLDEWDIDIRDLAVATSIGDNTDVKLGRQVLTWGTGDLVFLNDLFAKDWQSFFSGRDDEYLKAASNSLKISYYHDWANIDQVYTPEFTPDNYINGERFSFYNPLGLPPGFSADEPNDDEWSARVYGNIEQLEWALYGYVGYSKSPEAFINGQPTFSALNAWGASLSQPIAGGLANMEVSYFDSKDDRDGNNPFIPNSQWRGLIGYEHELITSMTLSGQYYIEHFTDYKAALETKDQTRHLLTMRLTYRAMQEKLTLSLFSFYSPSDDDAYLRPVATYRFNDQWSSTVGGNLFMGKEETSFFGQFEDASNVYWRLRYHY